MFSAHIALTNNSSLRLIETCFTATYFHIRGALLESRYKQIYPEINFCFPQLMHTWIRPMSRLSSFFHAHCFQFLWSVSVPFGPISPLTPRGPRISRHAPLSFPPRGPEGPVMPFSPFTPRDPVGPVMPISPLAPSRPLRPGNPLCPFKPLLQGSILCMWAWKNNEFH